MTQGYITPIASTATAIQSGGRLPLPIAFKIAIINAANAQIDVTGGIMSRSLLSVRMVSCLEVADSSS
jgi:hypothetical protein